MKTKQETFDKIAKSLLTQGCSSSNINSCLYRGPNNTKCAAGWLIPDEKYNSQWEGKFLANEGPIAKVLEEEEYDPNFVIFLQRIHDACSDEWYTWKQEMIDFAKEFNLSTSVFGE